MAKQKGLIKLKGTIGDITFYKSKDGFIAKEKGGIEASRIATDPAFQRTRENGAEFGRAGKAGKLLRTAFKPLMIHAKDKRMVGRLTQQMVVVLQADSLNKRGLRTVTDGAPELLTGFEFNINGKLSTSLFAPIVPTIDRAAGILSITIDPFDPSKMINTPAGTTHFKIIAAGAAINFENDTYEVKSSESGLLPWTGDLTAPINLVQTVTPGSTHPLFMVVGLEFFQEVNGEMYSLKSEAFNPLSLVAVDGI